MGHLPTPRHTAGASQTSTGNGEGTFILYCPSCETEGNLHELIHALYYLPQNFQLLVMDNTRNQLGKIMTWADKNITDRIQFEQTGPSQEKTSPFFYANAVIYNDTDADDYDDGAAPHVKVSKSTDRITSDKHHGYRVAEGNPEALATALLKIARTTI